MTKTASTETASGGTTYTAGDGLELSGTEFTTGLKSNGGLVIESTDLAVDLAASSITGILAVADGGTGAGGGADSRSNLGLGTSDDVQFNTLSVVGGSNTSPSLFNSSDTNTGVYFPGADTVAITTGGTKRFDVNTSSVDITLPINLPTGSAGAASVYSSDTETGIYFGDTELHITLGADPAASFIGDGLEVKTSLGVGTSPSGTTGEIRATNDITAFYSSDKRLKDNITPITDPLSKLSQLGGYTFDWIPKEGIHSHEGRDVGVIAQEVEEVLPEVTTTRGNGYKAVKYEKIVPLLIECIKAQQSQIDELKETLSELKN